MRVAEMIASKPFREDDVETWLRWIAEQHGGLNTAIVRGRPLDLIRKFVDHGCGIEFRSVAVTDESKRQNWREQQQSQELIKSAHDDLPLASKG